MRVFALDEVCMCVVLTASSEGGPTIFAQVKNGVSVNHIIDLILSAWRGSGASEGSPNK